MKKYQEMRQKFLNKEISQKEWQEFCFNFMFSDPDFIAMCQRMKHR